MLPRLSDALSRLPTRPKADRLDGQLTAPAARLGVTQRVHLDGRGRLAVAGR